jgi:hypothetical protein
MNSVRKFFSPWKALIAAVAFCATTSAAKADLYLQITDVTGQAGPAIVDLGASGGTGTTSAFSSEGFTIKYTASESYGNNASLTLSASVINTGMTSGNSTVYSAGAFKFQLVSSTTTGAVSSLPTSATSGFFSPALVGSGQQIGLYSTLSTTDFVSGSKVTANSSYTGYNGSTAGGIQSITPGGSYSTSLNSGNSSSTGGIYKFNQAAGTTSFDLSSVSVDVQSGGGSAGTVSFKASAIAMPEPSGIAAALAGLPCLGLLVGYARRRRVSVSPAV